MMKTFREAFLCIDEEDMLFRQSVNFSVRKGGLFYDDLREHVRNMYQTVRDVPLKGASNNRLLTYYAYTENMPTFFSDMFDAVALIRDFREIPEWDIINLDLLPESVPDGQINFFALTDSEWAALAPLALKMNPLPIRWTNEALERVLCAAVADSDAETAAEAVAARYLFDAGFRVGYRSHFGLQEKLTIPKREDYPREDIFNEYWDEFRGDLYSFISCYQAMKKARKLLIGNA